MDLPELESYFQNLTDITDNVAVINTHYEADHDSDFNALEDFFEDLVTKPWEQSDDKYYQLFTSYFTFHVKIVEEIIREAREILNPEKREYLKKLVNYQKSASDWFTNLRKKRKSVLAA
ncbi:MAG: PLU-1-like domain protein [Leptospiraceae bacterium]|nr:PLU-1-like domain protein [Leptospiraceae bacterium]